MRIILLSTLLAVTLVSNVKAQGLTSERTATPEQKEILRIEHDKLRAIAEGGTAEADWYDRMEDEGLAQTEPDGGTMTKAQHVAARRSRGESVKGTYQDHYDYNVRVYNGNTAVVTYLGYGITASNGKLSKLSHSTTTDVFVKQNGQWHTVVHHVTRMPGEEVKKAE